MEYPVIDGYEIKPNAYLYRAELIGANLVGLDLRRANLIRADLTEADMRRANLVEANLLEANLGEANLVGTNLVGTNLRGANLYRADLRGSDLGRADLRGTYLGRAKLPYPILQVGPIGGQRDYLVYQVGIDEVRAGSLLGTLDEFAEAVEKEHGENEHGRAYRIVITMLRAMREEWTTKAREVEQP